MIPLKLQIKNFLSFGAEIQTIDFTPYSLICLSGKNGHGKSALLDAMTWVLWGQGRKMAGVAKSDDHLVRLGQTHMMVGMQFMCNGQEYRVRREYTRSSNKPYVTLDVGIFDSEQRSFIPIGGKSIRSSQAALEQVIHLDFDSFCNSAFLRQGQSNEFSKKSPKERKEILASILGLDEYESIRALASEYARSAATSRISMQAILDRMMQDLASVSVLDERLNALREKYACVEKQEMSLIRQEQELAKSVNNVRDMQQALKIIDVQMHEIKKDEDESIAVLRDLSKSWRSVHVKQLKAATVAELIGKKNKIIEQLQIQQQAMLVSLDHKEQFLKQKELVHHFEVEHAHLNVVRTQEVAVQLERSKLELEHYRSLVHASDARMGELEQEKILAEKELQALLERQNGMIVDSAVHEKVERQFEKRKAFYQNWITLGNVLTGELQNMDRKKKLSQDENNPCCPLCEQNLSSSRRRFLKDKFVQEEHFLCHRIDRIGRVVKKVKVLLIEQHAQLIDFARLRDENQKIVILIDAVRARLLAIAQEVDSCMQQKTICESQIALFISSIACREKELQAQQVEARAALLENVGYKNAVEQLHLLEKTVSENRYDSARRDQLCKELEDIEKMILDYDTLRGQVALQDSRREQIGSLVLRIKAMRKELQSLYVQKAKFKALPEQESLLLLKEQEIRTSNVAIKQQKETLLQDLGGLECERLKLKALEQEALDGKIKIAEIDNRIDDYQAIATATGKDGIQALLIQDILPEVEQEANDLLAKLTDNQAQIFIESLRDLKKGGAKETLDINISDTMGIRPYEMFSGGEAFRIDFALRIALSKMLARRAGTSLQTLIIDEGFGSQDEEGLAHIMDALYRIQDDFAKIIIVSHLPSMKDHFPVHFHVEKKPSGSIVSIIEQG